MMLRVRSRPRFLPGTRAVPPVALSDQLDRL
jgi:hypothetical protein